eukprot:gene53062-40548_t
MLARVQGNADARRRIVTFVSGELEHLSSAEVEHALMRDDVQWDADECVAVCTAAAPPPPHDAAGPTCPTCRAPLRPQKASLLPDGCTVCACSECGTHGDPDAYVGCRACDYDLCSKCSGAAPPQRTAASSEAAPAGGGTPTLSARSVGDLRRIAAERGVSLSGCIEKSDVVRRLEQPDTDAAVPPAPPGAAAVGAAPPAAATRASGQPPAAAAASAGAGDEGAALRRRVARLEAQLAGTQGRLMAADRRAEEGRRALCDARAERDEAAERARRAEAERLSRASELSRLAQGVSDCPVCRKRVTEVIRPIDDPGGE